MRLLFFILSLSFVFSLKAQTAKDVRLAIKKMAIDDKILKEKISDTEYLNFELENIADFPKLIEEENISGLNVTIPYKEEIIPFLDNLTDSAKVIGAVNTIEFRGDKLIGHNTDIIGFKKSITPILDKKALNDGEL